MRELPKFNTDNIKAIENKETLNWLEKRATKLIINKARKNLKKLKQNLIKEDKDNKKLIKNIMELTEVLNIEDEDTGQEITEETLAIKTQEELIDLFEEALNEAYKLI